MAGAFLAVTLQSRRIIEEKSHGWLRRKLPAPPAPPRPHPAGFRPGKIRRYITETQESIDIIDMKKQEETEMEYFSIEELEASATATKRGIKNKMPEAARENAERLIEMVLDPARRRFGKPIRVTSGYRCPLLNKAVGGARRSYHLQGRAADLVTESIQENQRLYGILQLLPHRELIWEQGGRWIHVAI